MFKEKYLSVIIIIVGIWGSLLLVGCAKDTEAPVIISTHPPKGNSEVAINTLLSATFGEEMDSTTINTSTFSVDNGVKGMVYYKDKTASFPCYSDYTSWS